MSDTLTCPRCGEELKLMGRTAGQRFQCPRCQAWVDVPVLRRTIKRGRRLATPRERPLVRGRETSRRVWVGFGAGTLAVLLVLLVVQWIFTVRARREQVRAVEALAEQAKALARERNYGAAVNEIETARVQALRIEPTDRALLLRLKDLYDQIIVNEVKSQFPKLDALAPEQRVEAYRALRSRIRDNPNLARYEEAANSRLDLAYEQWGEADLKQAASLLKANKAARAMDLCERAVGNTATLTGERRHGIRAEADALVSQIIPRRGLILEPMRGQYTLGSESSYTAVLQRDLAEVLRQRGYVIRPDSSFWGDLWKQQTPFRVRVDVKEQYGGLYPQTKCRISYIVANVVLERQQWGQQSKVWAASVSTRTEGRVPNLKEFRKEFQNPAIEKIFYDNARASFAKGIMSKLLTVPECQAQPGFGSGASGPPG
jgi:hypothetical protein